MMEETFVELLASISFPLQKSGFVKSHPCSFYGCIYLDHVLVLVYSVFKMYSL